MQCFVPLLKLVRSYVVKYRMSSRAKIILNRLFEKRLPRFIPSQWYRYFFTFLFTIEH